MSLPQLIGLKCVICQKQVDSVREADFCGRCGNPVHNACLEHGDVKVAEGKCADCGGDPADSLAMEVQVERKLLDKERMRRLQQGIAISPESIQQIVPVSKVCPKCGGTNYTKRKPRATVAFVFDRVCSDCNTRYSPPTPTCASIVFLLVGLALTMMGLLSVIGALFLGNPTGLVCWGPLGVVGLLAAIFGIKSLIDSANRSP